MVASAWRRLVVAAVFVAVLGLVVVLNRRAAGSAAGAGALGFRLSEVARESGIEFVHQATTLDPKIQHIAPYLAALGACVSVTDVNNDGWPDLYFTTSRFGTANALYLNRGN